MAVMAMMVVVVPAVVVTIVVAVMMSAPMHQLDAAGRTRDCAALRASGSPEVGAACAVEAITAPASSMAAAGSTNFRRDIFSLHGWRDGREPTAACSLAWDDPRRRREANLHGVP